MELFTEEPPIFPHCSEIGNVDKFILQISAHCMALIP